ncbi:MAG: preprotein translocase subunit SecE [Thermoleophilia bacterium]
MARIRPARNQGEEGPKKGEGAKTPARRQSGPPSPRPQQQPKREKTGSVTKAVQERRSGSQFLTDVIVELRKVQWPTRSQLMQSTAVVLLVVVVVVVYLAAVDAVVSRAVHAIF